MTGKQKLRVFCGSLQDKTRCLFVEQSCFPPYCYIDTGSGTVHKLISKELIGKYRCHLRKGLR